MEVTIKELRSSGNTMHTPGKGTRYVWWTWTQGNYTWKLLIQAICTFSKRYFEILKLKSEKQNAKPNHLSWMPLMYMEILEMHCTSTLAGQFKTYPSLRVSWPLICTVYHSLCCWMGWLSTLHRNTIWEISDKLLHEVCQKHLYWIWPTATQQQSIPIPHRQYAQVDIRVEGLSTFLQLCYISILHSITTFHRNLTSCNLWATETVDDSSSIAVDSAKVEMEDVLMMMNLKAALVTAVV